MAVFERGYRGYSGPLLPEWNRFLVLARYGLAQVFRSRLFVAFFVACCVWPVVCLILIYLHYNVEALSIINLPIAELIKIDTFFFRTLYFVPQTAMTFFLVLFVGPALVSPDLRNNAMPLYLSRPLDKTDYVLGKFLVLAMLGSAITWVPGLVLFGFQSMLAGGGWALEHSRLAVGVFFGSWVWITVLSLFALAVSAWVKWKPFAAIVYLGGIFIFSAVGKLFKLVYGTWWGSLLVLDDLMTRVWDQLFGAALGEGRFGLPLGGQDVPAAAAWISLAVFAGLSLWALYRRIRAYEVVS
jgi:ABC-type transport system involved in multi-copper enzyme maturation permease subunit